MNDADKIKQLTHKVEFLEQKLLISDMRQIKNTACKSLNNAPELKKHNIVVSSGDLDFYAWPQTFGSTAGPSGCGGQSMTSFTVFGLLHELSGIGILLCGGKGKVVYDFKPFMRF